MPPGGAEMLKFSHLMLGVANSSSAELQPYRDTHSVINVVGAFSQLQLNVRTWPPVQIITEPRIYLLRRKLTNGWLWTVTVVDFNAIVMSFSSFSYSFFLNENLKFIIKIVKIKLYVTITCIYLEHMCNDKSFRRTWDIPCTIKRIPDIFSNNSSMHIWILIIFGRNVSQKVGNWKVE